MQLSSRLKTFYRSFVSEIIPTTIGAAGVVPCALKKSLKNGIAGINDMILKCQGMALLETMKIIKSVIKNKYKLRNTIYISSNNTCRVGSRTSDTLKMAFFATAAVTVTSSCL